MPVRLGYLVRAFPRVSETFIMNEILELEARNERGQSEGRDAETCRAGEQTFEEELRSGDDEDYSADEKSDAYGRGHRPYRYGDGA